MSRCVSGGAATGVEMHRGRGRKESQMPGMHERLKDSSCLSLVQGEGWEESAAVDVGPVSWGDSTEVNVERLRSRRGGAGTFKISQGTGKGQRGPSNWQACVVWPERRRCKLRCFQGRVG